MIITCKVCDSTYKASPQKTNCKYCGEKISSEAATTPRQEQHTPSSNIKTGLFAYVFFFLPLDYTASTALKLSLVNFNSAETYYSLDPSLISIVKILSYGLTFYLFHKLIYKKRERLVSERIKLSLTKNILYYAYMTLSALLFFLTGLFISMITTSLKVSPVHVHPASLLYLAVLAVWIVTDKVVLKFLAKRRSDSFNAPAYVN